MGAKAPKLHSRFDVCDAAAARNPLFARALQQAIGGVEGEIRVAMQYFFQACGVRGNPKFRDLLMNTAAEELALLTPLRS